MIHQLLRLLGLVALSFAVLGAAGAAAATRPPTVIKLVAVPTSAKVTDRAPKGPSTGDTVTETSRLLNEVAQFGKPPRAVVGSDRDVQRLRLNPRSLTVNGVTKLPGGTLLFRGKLERFGEDGTVIPVVGGTGRFLGAQGILVIVTAGKPARTLNIYRLTYARFA